MLKPRGLLLIVEAMEVSMQSNSNIVRLAEGRYLKLLLTAFTMDSAPPFDALLLLAISPSEVVATSQSVLISLTQ